MDSDATMRQAAEHLKAIASFKKGVKALFAPILEGNKATIQAARDAKATTEAQQATLLEPADQADSTLRYKVSTFEQARREAAERQRLAQTAAATERAVDDKIAKAAQLENIAKATGDQHYLKAAEQVLDAPVRVVTGPPAAPAKIKGMSFRQEVSIEVHDFTKLVIAAAEQCIQELRANGATDEQIAALRTGRADILALKADEVWLRREAVHRGEAFNVPGVTRHAATDVTVRA